MNQRTALSNAEKAAHYYQVAACNSPTKPQYIPLEVNVFRRVRGDGPFGYLCAEPGNYIAECNQWGAVSVYVGSGKLGLKLDEFEVVSWTLNPAAKGEVRTDGK